MERVLFCMFVYIGAAQFTNIATGTTAITTSFDVHNEINPHITFSTDESNNSVSLDDIANLAQKKRLDRIESYNLEIKRLIEFLNSKYNLIMPNEKHLEEKQSRINHLNETIEKILLDLKKLNGEQILTATNPQEINQDEKLLLDKLVKIVQILMTTLNQETNQIVPTNAAFEEYMTALNLVNTKIVELRSFIEKELKKLPHRPRKGEKHPKYIPRNFAAAHATVLV